MAFCTNCGNQLGGEYCATCGTSAQGTPVQPQPLSTAFAPRPMVVVAAPTKSVGISLLLTFLFGPLGMLYSTVVGGLVMMVISFFVAIFTLGFGLLITWPVCIIWGALAAKDYNERITGMQLPY